MTEVFNEDCISFMRSEKFRELTKDRKVCIVTDPPFNVGYHYDGYNDRLSSKEYNNLLTDIFTMYDYPFVVIHYPEALYQISWDTHVIPERVVSWVYNSNTPRQHRDVAYFNVKPNFSQMIQPYKNPNDKRIKERIANGHLGGKLYDWWEINQIKNVSKEKNGNPHPCSMPVEVMKRVVGVLPKDTLIYDPFTGSGTTGVACVELGYDFIGTEMNTCYCDYANKRISESQSLLRQDVKITETSDMISH